MSFPILAPYRRTKAGLGFWNFSNKIQIQKNIYRSKTLDKAFKLLGNHLKVTKIFATSFLALQK
jgi:hypothetical protein